MLRSVRIQPLSILVGLVLGVVCFLTMSQTAVPTPLRVEYTPHPRDMVQIKEGTPYTVPNGKIFTLTGLGYNGHAPGDCDSPGLYQLDVWLTVDSGPDLRPCRAEVSSRGPTALAVSIQPAPEGFTAVAGTTLQVSSLNCLGCPVLDRGARAWGYLVNQ